MIRPFPRMIAVAAGTAFQLGLAVWLRGGAAASLAHPPLRALALALLGMGVAAMFAGGNLSPGVREDRGNR